jgi:hypothetical protein
VFCLEICEVLRALEIIIWSMLVVDFEGGIWMVTEKLNRFGNSME